MSIFCNDNRRGCTTIAIIASVIIGIVAAFLRITAVITVTPAFLWVVFGIAVAYLAVLLGTMAITRRSGYRSCLCTTLAVLLAGILGTILFSILLLAITFAATSIIGAIIVGLLLLSFSLIISTTACLVLCLANCND